jgi:hypothetical protein
MSDWKEEFKKAVEKVVLEKGTPTTEADIEYGYASGWVWGVISNNWKEIRDHQKVCKFTGSKIESVHWSEFDGTDCPNVDRHGLYTVASCECGKWEDVTFVYEASLEGILNSLLEA